MNDVPQASTEAKAKARAELGRIVREVLGIGPEDGLPLSDEVLLASEIGLGASEFLELVQRVRERCGVDLSERARAELGGARALEEQPLSWVIAQLTRN